MEIVLKAAQMIDGHGGEPVRDAAVVINGSQITYAGPAAGAQWSPEAQVIQSENGTIMPGLFDVHVHITTDGGPNEKEDVLGTPMTPFPEMALKGYANALRSLNAGYTTLRNLHTPGYADLPLRDIMRSGRLLGPRLLVCGQGLCITGGHMDKTNLPDHVSATGRVGVCDSPEGFRQAVRQHVKMKVDLIKINSDMGSSRNPKEPYYQEMPFDEMKAACDEAHRFGLHVAAHTAGGWPLEDAVRAGVDTVEHGHWLTDKAIEMMLERGAYYVPTLLVNSMNFDYDRETLGASEATWTWLKMAYDAKWDSLERARKAGVKIAAGGDAGFLVDHGQNAGELAEMVKGGLTPMEAILAATKTAAELCRVDHEVGTLEAGKLADVIVVDANPLDDITVLQQLDRITHVLKDGRIAKAPGVPALVTA